VGKAKKRRKYFGVASQHQGNKNERKKIKGGEKQPGREEMGVDSN